jgi:hypothetical protein
VPFRRKLEGAKSRSKALCSREGAQHPFEKSSSSYEFKF